MVNETFGNSHVLISLSASQKSGLICSLVVNFLLGHCLLFINITKVCLVFFNEPEVLQV